MPRYTTVYLVSLEDAAGESSIIDTLARDNHIPLVCNGCGDLWGKVTALTMRADGEVEEQRWHAVPCLCKKCGDGSLLQWYIFGQMEERRKEFTLTRDLVLRELNLILGDEHVGDEAQNV